MMLAKLFFAFLKVGFFAVGGAYSFLPLIEKEVVENYRWLSKEEFLDVLGMVQVSPGAISIKYATYTGYKVSGILGAIAANIGNLLAPVILVIFTSFFYIKYKNIPFVKSAFNMIQVAMFAMIIALAFQTMNVNQLSHVRNIFIIVLSFILFVYAKVHPALIIICAGILGVFLK